MLIVIFLKLLLKLILVFVYIIKFLSKLIIIKFGFFRIIGQIYINKTLSLILNFRKIYTYLRFFKYKYKFL